MRRTFVSILVCFLFFAFTIAAQQPAASGDQAAQMKERIAQLQSRLKLTPDQVEKIKPILQQEATELRAVRDKHAGDTSRRGRISRAREMKGVAGKYSPQIDAILTPDQQKEWKKIKEERKEEFKEKRGR